MIETKKKSELQLFITLGELDPQLGKNISLFSINNTDVSLSCVFLGSHSMVFV